ncbi:unnamed protein product [Adineta steineri]|uniref:LITAF domain-containing protein n=1 Tax=Adineta steineri TaxID=433720 RepID=A0A814EZS5_9BILA|nr:unnamed protein product [Adineta steineri]CAF1301284.1 unnamed protein product [Adineta steineri]
MHNNFHEPVTTNEPSSSSNLNDQTLHQHSYEQSNQVNHTNTDQQYHITYAITPEEPPPSYYAALQSSSNPSNIYQPKTIDETRNPPQLNYQGTPFPPGYRWPRFSTNAVCPHCGVTGHTRVHTTSTALTFALAIILFLFCCCLFIIPFCLPSCKKTTHQCSHCHAILGEVNEFQ